MAISVFYDKKHGQVTRDFDLAQFNITIIRTVIIARQALLFSTRVVERFHHFNLIFFFEHSVHAHVRVKLAFQHFHDAQAIDYAHKVVVFVLREHNRLARYNVFAIFQHNKFHATIEIVHHYVNAIVNKTERGEHHSHNFSLRVCVSKNSEQRLCQFQRVQHSHIFDNDHFGVQHVEIFFTVYVFCVKFREVVITR
uniref:ORF-18 n=1 Tax=Buzura suppressaria nuclear polyhedrosis virus TaxID=74320 RepID=A0A0N7CU74_NPVBS|nr:ORF-18 [Buzura suppressaria nucleopolyhedrovirus]